MRTYLNRISVFRILGLLLALFLGVSAQAQTMRVVFSSSEMTVGEAIAEIEQQTGYEVAFYQVYFDPAYRVQLARRSTELPDALDQLIDGRDFEYLIRNRYIVINPAKPKPKPVVAQRTVVSVPRTSDRYSPNDPNALSAAPVRRPEVEGEPLQMPLVVLEETVEPYYSDYSPLSRHAYIQDHLPRFALKTNLLYWAAQFTPNLGIEFGLGRRTSLSITGGHNPYNLNDDGTATDNKKLVHTSIRPEFRYWLCERYNGHFFGVSAFYNKFNVSGYDIPFADFKKEFRYQGYAVGGGFNYGYHLPLSKRWGLEFTVGVGVAVMDYKQYDCERCGDYLEKQTKTYFGPTNAGINLVFMIR